MVTTLANPQRPVAGVISIVFGAAALMLVLVHFWAGPFAPQQSASVTVGEIAAEIRQSALRKLAGKPQPKPAQAEWDVDRLLKLIAAVLAGCAVVASTVGFVRHEAKRPAIAGIALGAGALTFQLFTWAILIIVGAIILSAIIGNIGETLGG